MLSSKEVWDVVLQVKSKLDKQNLSSLKALTSLSIENVSGDFAVNIPANKITDGLTLNVNFTKSLNIDDLVNCVFSGKVFSDDASKEILKMYLPYCFIKYYALKNQSCVAVSHFAQTLDGKIATSSGKSQWIGNEENLLHAHRMRAICDGILIGGGTLTCDNPSLSVRLVKGDNPVKILIGSKEYDKRKIELGSELIEVSPKSTNSNVAACFNGNKLNCKDLLKFLFDQGVCSVYIEGGSKTTSSFIHSNAIDVVQVHIAPIILGSGITGFDLPEVNEICEGIKFSDFKFHRVGNEIMFTGSKNQSSE